MSSGRLPSWMSPIAGEHARMAAYQERMINALISGSRVVPGVVASPEILLEFHAAPPARLHRPWTLPSAIGDGPRLGEKSSPGCAAQKF